MLGKQPPVLESERDVTDQLCRSPNKGLNFITRVLGVVTTPFKRSGIQGWSDFGWKAYVEGTVVQAAWSTDCFYTVDLRVETLVVNDKHLDVPANRFLRAEICLGEVYLTKSQRPRRNNRVRIGGQLMWDWDGFLEVHPLGIGDVVVVKE